MSKLFKNLVGIDISKSWFDATLITKETATKAIHHQFAQTAYGYAQLLQWLQDHNTVIEDETLFCMEYTGFYNTALVNFLVHHSSAIWVEMPLRIKKASVLERGSDDKSASHKIAWYAVRYNDQAKLWKPADTSIEKLKHLITQRERIITSLKHLSVPAQELIDCGCIKEGNML